MISFVLFFITLILFIILYYVPKKPKNFPPGPRWLPLLGSSPQLKKLTQKLGYQHLALSWLAKQYGSVMGLCLGSQMTVAVSGNEAVRQILTQEDFEGRPDNFFIRLRSMGTRKGITCTDGPHWHEQRNFAVRHLRSLGLGKRTMETLIMEEVQEMLENMDKQVGSLVQPDFAPHVMSILWALTAGSKFENNDLFLQRLLELMQRRSRAFDMSGGILSQFPCLRFISPEGSGFTLLNAINTELHKFFMDTIASHQADFRRGEEARDLIDAYLQEIDSRQHDEKSTFTESQLVMVCLDMFVAGSTTTSNSLSFAMLYLSLHPTVQAKVCEELDFVLGKDCPPTLADQSRLPYLSAVILEILRICHVTPVTGPRRALRDTELQGYSIPKDTTILMNIWSVHNDPEHWGDPQNFRPERFIKGEKLKQDDWLMPFGLGRRRCPGEPLARGCMFLFLACVLQRFRLIAPENSSTSLPSPLPGLTLSPPQYQLCIERR